MENRIDSLTFDAFAKNILDRFRLALPPQMIPKQNYTVNDFKIIEKACNLNGINYCGGGNKEKFYNEQLMSAGFPLDGNSSAERAWLYLLHGFDEQNASLSYKMIMRLAVYIIKNNVKIRNALRYTYSHVFLDEFQDTTELQYTLLKECFHGSKAVVTAVGDEKQRIMLWAGAKKNVFEDFLQTFNAKRIILLINYRSAPRLVHLQKNMYASLKADSLQVDSSKKWREDDGEVILLESENEEAENNALLEDIKKRLLIDNTPINDMVILCKKRPKEYTKSLIDKLSANGRQSVKRFSKTSVNNRFRKIYAKIDSLL